jgi:hypothetical protein
VSVSDFNGFFTFGMDQFHDGLGLGKVHPTVEEGCAGELSGLGQLATSCLKVFEDFAGNEWIAMTGDLEDGFACIGLAFSEESVENFVDDLVVYTSVSAKIGLSGNDLLASAKCRFCDFQT